MSRLRFMFDVTKHGHVVLDDFKVFCPLEVRDLQLQYLHWDSSLKIDSKIFSL